jgi:hypothetical protein
MAPMMTEQEFWDILKNMPQPKPVFWRLYYDAETGNPICYSMEDQPGNYVDVDPDTFARSPFNLRVINGQIKYFSTQQTQKLTPSEQGTPCHPNDVAVVVKQNQLHQCWRKKTYDTEN